MTFGEQSVKPNLWNVQQSIWNYWKDNHIFEKSVEQRPAENPYRFYDGPPFITGLPHYGHLASSVAKDVIPRYWTMKGKRVERVWWWDCHGIPIEDKVQKKFGLESSLDIEDFGVEKFVEGCYDYTRSTSSEWKWYVDNFGRWVDFDNSYKTMDNDYMESVWWVFKQIWEKWLIYKGKRVSLYSTKLETPISNFEVAMDDSYDDVNDPAVTVTFKLASEDSFVMAWTTTPWTLPANMALGVHEDIDYVKVLSEDVNYILARARVEDVFKWKEYEIVDEFKGSTLIGLSYVPLFGYYKERGNEKDYRIVFADFATDDSGTGIVHQAPEFGEDDFNLWKKEGLTMTEAMDASGHYSEELSDLVWTFYRDANDIIMERLKEKGQLFKKASITHRVAHCPRTKLPLVYKAQDSWFIDIQSVKQKLLDKNEDINWYPEHFKHGRFAKSIESAPDWCISRTRYWGTPMPVYVPADALNNGKIDAADAIVVGSRAELYELQKNWSNVIEKRWTEASPVFWNTKRDCEFDMHKPFVDDVWFEKDGVRYERIPEVLDCWMESGSMPYGQMHYPFANKEKMEASFPADYIVEYTGQIRAWFYVMHVLGVILFDKPAFKNVICHGVVYGDDGRKMSKSLGNYPDPKPTFEQYGWDAVRMSILTSSLFNAGDTSISEDGIAEALRKNVLPLWNAFYFLTTYARIDWWGPSQEWQVSVAWRDNVLDTWIIWELHTLISVVDNQLSSYDLQQSSRQLTSFLDNLSNWYIRRSRRRFWKTESDDDKIAAYETLYYVLVTFCRVAAPFMPFVTEYVYRELTDGLNSSWDERSVHLENWPASDARLIDTDLSRDMALVQDVIRMGLGWRSQQNIRVRQPLASLTLGVVLSDYYKWIVADELNIKDVICDTGINDLVTKICKPNGRKIWPKYGKDVKMIIQEAKAGNFVENDDGSVTVNHFRLEVGEFDISYIKREDTDSSRDVFVENGLVMTIDGHITPALELEWYARDLVRYIQEARKEADYAIDDRIHLSVSRDSSANFVDDLLAAHGDYIQQETLSTLVSDVTGNDLEKTVDLGKDTVSFVLKK